MNQPRPLTEFGWLEVAQKVRNAATNIALDKLATEKDIGHTPGTRVKNRVAYATHLPDAVDVVLPAISFGDKSIGETHVQIVPMIAPKSAVVIECTAQSMAYVQLAMHASAKDTVSRARPKHNDRFSAATGVLGVTLNKKRRLMRRVVVNADGKRTYTHQSLVDEAGQAEQAASFKRRAFFSDACRTWRRSWCRPSARRCGATQ